MLMNLGDGIFNISSAKNMNGVYSGMLQLYEHAEYSCHYQFYRTSINMKENEFN